MKILYLLKKDILESRKGMMIYGLTLFIIMLLSSTISMLVDGPYYVPGERTDYIDFFISFLMLGGFIIASLAFREEMYGKTTQHNWLMLPASPLAKLTVKMITVLIIYPLTLMIFITLSSFLIEGFNFIVHGAGYPIMNPFLAIVWKPVLNYIVIGSVFLMGSSYFRKAAFVKTVLSLGLFAFIAGLLTILFGRVIFSEYFTGMELNEELFIRNFTLRFDSPRQVTEFRIFETLSTVMYWVLLAPFCWIVSYFRVREVQAYDAV